MKLIVMTETTYNGSLILHTGTRKLYINREDGTTVEIPVTKVKVQELIDLGVNTGS